VSVIYRTAFALFLDLGCCVSDYSQLAAGMSSVDWRNIGVEQGFLTGFFVPRTSLRVANPTDAFSEKCI